MTVKVGGVYIDEKHDITVKVLSVNNNQVEYSVLGKKTPVKVPRGHFNSTFKEKK
jgi:sRNA-binding carbon storage regulator CsrA